MLSLLALLQAVPLPESVLAAKNVNGLLGAGIGIGLAIVGAGVGAGRVGGPGGCRREPLSSRSFSRSCSSLFDGARELGEEHELWDSVCAAGGDPPRRGGARFAVRGEFRPLPVDLGGVCP